MKTFTLYLVLIAALSFATSGLAEIVQWDSCDEEEDACTVNELEVQPCAEAASGAPCRIRTGTTASISFGYTPNFAGDKLNTRAYWANDFGDLPFMGMNTNACASTPCPATPGRRQTYNNTLPIASSYPPRTYEVKWKLWNAEGKQCCFIFNIELVK